MKCVWDAGVRNELFSLIYLLNKNANITVGTPFRPNDEFRVTNLEKQGTCMPWANIMWQLVSIVLKNIALIQEFSLAH